MKVSETPIMLATTNYSTDPGHLFTLLPLVFFMVRENAVGRAG